LKQAVGGRPETRVSFYQLLAFGRRYTINIASPYE
jgi:hypothetical protein